MRSIVVSDEYNEIDLKPSDLIHTYMKLAEEDVRNLFVKSARLLDVPSPAFPSSKGEDVFTKFGMTYKRCDKTGTLFVSPRPDDKTIIHYYQTAKSQQFWQNSS